MVSFRKEKKKRRMRENKVAAEKEAASYSADIALSAPTDASSSSAAEEIRITDRRRINMEGEADGRDATGATRNFDRAPVVESPNLKPKYVEQLEARALAAEQKLFEIQSRFDQARLDLQRETDETRQRLNRAADDRARREKGDFIAALLPVADNLHRAIEAAQSGGTFESVLAGVRGTASNFDAALTSAGVETIAAVGTQFDPELHEAVDTVDVDGVELDGRVTAEYSRGYKMGDRLLRPARVQVGRAAHDKTKNAAEQ